MKRNLGFAALALALVAVTIQNVRFFRSLDAPPGSLEQADEGGWEAGPDEADTFAELETRELQPLTPVVLASYLMGLETGSPARSPFMTLAESEHRTWETGAAAPDTPLPVLAGTLWSRQRRVAWIDGVPRTEGDLVAGFVVMEIDRDSVLLASDGEEIRLHVSAPSRPILPQKATNDPESLGDGGEI